MRLDIYLNYPGNCEQAFRFYEEHLGGRLTGLQRHGQQPQPATLPADWTGKVLHARIEIGDTVLMGADIPESQPLSDGGQVFMKMEETFFASRFAMLRDRFGTSWMLLHERQGSPGTGRPASTE